MSGAAGGVGRNVPRTLDHIVLPFETLVAARNVFDTMGFTVAPDAVHPFGTGNACVFFTDGIYLEPLAKIDASVYADAVDAGQLFVARDSDFRSRHSLPAISAMAFKSGDALADRAELAEAGIGEESLVEFRRTFETATGERREMGFRLAFATPDRVLDATAFFCQPLHESAPDRSSLIRHANGATGLLRVVFSGNDTSAIADRQAQVGRSSISPSDDLSGVATVVLGNCEVEIVSNAALVERYRGTPADAAGAICGLVLGVENLGATRHLLHATHIAMWSVDDRIIVPLGSSTCFIAFEEVSS